MNNPTHRHRPTEICSEDACTGCASCAAVCPLSCITMQDDRTGVSRPVIDSERCVGCGKCVTTCPNHRDDSALLLSSRACYASWRTDAHRRRKSASGGIASLLAEHVVAHGGAYYATRYDEQLVPRVMCATTEEELPRYRGSIYAQSIFDRDTYHDILHTLQSGRRVLFVGTPCQVAGLKSYLAEQGGKEVEAWAGLLITADLLCHGGIPTRYFTDELAYLKKRHGWERVTEVRFRSNDPYDYRFTVWDGERLLQNRSGYCSPYLASFIQGISFRESCYACRYAQVQRVADITLGDFMGLGSREPVDFDKHHVSFVSLNSEEGEALWQEVVEGHPELEVRERDYAERQSYPYSLLCPYPRHPKQCAFRRRVGMSPFPKAIRRTMAFKLWRSRMWEIYRTNVRRIKKILQR